jgi:hypothetical protein
MANPAYRESIIQNLLTSSLKYGLKKEQRRIKIFCFQKESEIALSIQVIGKGLSVSKINRRILKPVVRFHRQVAEGQEFGLLWTKYRLEMMIR